MMSLYGQYIKEREGTDIIETEDGFATYSIFPESKTCYVKDIYIRPEARRSGVASTIVDRIVEIAKQNYCTELLGTVDPTTIGATESMKAQFGYGFKLKNISGSLIVLSKNLEV